jgi:UDP-glucose 4-epimerase
VTVARPFNTYGPFQRADSEGGVVSIFLSRSLAGQPLLVRGDGRQTRDLLYVEDCADFLLRAALAPAAEGEIVNAGTGQDLAILDLARRIAPDERAVTLVPHDHPQAEIARLLCDPRKAERLLGWRARTSLEQGLARTREWLRTARPGDA